MHIIKMCAHPEDVFSCCWCGRNAPHTHKTQTKREKRDTCSKDNKGSERAPHKKRRMRQTRAPCAARAPGAKKKRKSGTSERVTEGTHVRKQRCVLFFPWRAAQAERQQNTHALEQWGPRHHKQRGSAAHARSRQQKGESRLPQKRRTRKRAHFGEAERKESVRSGRHARAPPMLGDADDEGASHPYARVRENVRGEQKKALGFC